MKTDARVNAAYENLLKRVPSEVAARLVEKYDAERAQFLKVVEDMLPSKDSSYWAQRSCTKCNGRGIIGTLVKPSGEVVVPACACTAKNYAKWLVKVRQYYNALVEQGHEKTAD